ncbi:RAMP superfamily CRISPR-associated protein [Deltaproteobacteria bacterium TL4]
MLLRGKLFSESPIYRGNARKTLFTRDGDGKQRLVSLAGEIQGTAQSLMDAFIGTSKDGKNTGLLPQLWQRLYSQRMPADLINQVTCKLMEKHYPNAHFFDLRMGIKLDEDRWAAEANANYKMETILRNSAFELTLDVNERILKSGANQTCLYYLLSELKAGRFWFGAGKSRGLGKCHLEMDLPFQPNDDAIPDDSMRANHLTLSLQFGLANPILVGWNWGKLDENMPTMLTVEGRVLIEMMQSLPLTVRERLAMGIGGPILSISDWKKKLANALPKAVTASLLKGATQEKESWILSAKNIAKLSKGKYPLSKKILDLIQPLIDQAFVTKEEAEGALSEALGADNAKKNKRIFEELTKQNQTVLQLNRALWTEIASNLGFVKSAEEELASVIADEIAVQRIVERECKRALPDLDRQIDRNEKLLQSDAWVEVELSNRSDHLQIKEMIFRGEIDEDQWGNSHNAPQGLKLAAWKEFLDAHNRVRFPHIANRTNLQKSITNDQNFIAYLKNYRNRTHQELAQPHNMDFRSGGLNDPSQSKQYGKPYDTIPMRMLSWTQSNKEESWEIYIPGSTIKGAFRKRASQLLKTFWGESKKTSDLLARLFGIQGRRGLILFSDAYLNRSELSEKDFCAMDGIKVDPGTGRPADGSKRDYLFAFGEELSFRFQLDLQDVTQQDLEALSLFKHLLDDLQRRDIPLGGERSNGFGWIRGELVRLDWLMRTHNAVSQSLFGKCDFSQEGLWKKVTLDSSQSRETLNALPPLFTQEKKADLPPPRAREGFISHRSFGGYCGMLQGEIEVLTPFNISESGQPSFSAMVNERPVNGWDFFSLSSHRADLKTENRPYAIPSLSLKGAIRHLYQIASDAKTESRELSHLNPVDSLFGWVGKGSNQSLSGRLAFDFGVFFEVSSAWFQAPYPYGTWNYTKGGWQEGQNKRQMVQIDKRWRVFPHTPLAPPVTQLESFEPDSSQAVYFRAMLPGSKARFAIRFWNLEKTELQRLIWCVQLEEGLAHKMGRCRALGFGSLKMKLLPESAFVDWEARYSNSAKSTSQLLRLAEWTNTSVVQHRDALIRVLNAEKI